MECAESKEQSLDSTTTAEDTTFSIEAFRVDGEPLTVDGLKATDPLSALTDQIYDALSVPRSHGATKLKLLSGDHSIPLTSMSQMLGDAGIGPGTVLTIILQAAPRIFEYHVTYEYDCCFAEDLSRLLLGNGCFLVRKQHDPCDATGSETRPLQWDILYGSYEIDDGVAMCAWEVHLRRTIENDDDGKKVTDSGWEKMDERASFRWRRLDVTDKTDFTLLEEKLESMSKEELTEAMREDMRSNGLGEDDIDVGDFETVEGLRENLMRFYKGEGLQLDWGTRLHAFSALTPGKLLGLSPRWIRLRKYEDQVAREDLTASFPGLDFSQSSLLGIKIWESIYPGGRYSDSDENSGVVDLSDLPQLLGL